MDNRLLEGPAGSGKIQLAYAVAEAAHTTEERRIGDPLRRRSFYLRVEHPTAEREAQIVALRTPESSREFHVGMAGLAKALRGWSLEKPPSVSEILDLARRLKFSGQNKLRRR
jgi:MoxR-like ATPase